MNNTRLRRYMSSDLELCEPVFHSLKLSISEQLGPQNLIDILRLMQVFFFLSSNRLLCFFNRSRHDLSQIFIACPPLSPISAKILCCIPPFYKIYYSKRKSIEVCFQALTYEKCVTLGVWANDLISFLMSEICQEPEPEWMPYCIAILCNLASRSKSVCNRIKKSVGFCLFLSQIIDLLEKSAKFSLTN